MANRFDMKKGDIKIIKRKENGDGSNRSKSRKQSGRGNKGKG